MAVWVAVFAAMAGACIGSFLNMLIHRIRPEGFLRLGHRSVCPSCQATIAWFDNLPILSWLILRGRCRRCRAAIGPRYLAVEVLAAGAALLATRLRAGEHWLVDPGTALRIAVDLLFVALLLTLSFIDLRDRLLPDVLTLPGLAAGILLSVLMPELHAGTLVGNLDMAPEACGFLAAALGAGVGAASIWLVSVFGRWVFRQEAMGFGDVKFMAFTGAFLGVEGALLTFLIGCLAGAAGGALRMLFTRDPYIPFGPFLALGAAAVWFFRPTIVDLLFVHGPGLVAGTTLGRVGLAVTMLGLIVLLLVLRRRRRAG
jgi:leader peptidase (prepilin peptidase)/N-methyltransferase